MFGHKENLENSTFGNSLQMPFESLFGDKYSIVL